MGRGNSLPYFKEETMAYIEPNSTIKLLTNCPLDNTYDHTIYFTSASAQTSYFEGLTKYGYLEYSYVRQNRTLKVQAPVGANLYDCNYMMFKNNSFENKWFYAFINHVEYVNNLTWEIQFELDVMQSWMFDYQLEQCFVEREHSATDNLFENLVPENLETGEYISDGITRCADSDSSTESLLEDLSLVFACTFDRQYNDFRSGYYAGLYSGLCFVDFALPKPATTANIASFNNTITQWIDGAVNAGKVDGILSAFVIPTTFVRSSTSSSTSIGFTKQVSFNDVDGYVPKNKKLFSYPYNFMYVTNFQGSSVPFMFEYFSNPVSLGLGFRLEANYAPDMDIVLTPLNYKGVGLSNYDEKLTLSKFPQLPFSSDVWKAWTAMDMSGSLLGLGASIAGGAIAGSVVPGIGNVAGAGIGLGVGAVSLISNLVKTGFQKAIAPPQNHGSTAGSHTLASLHLIDFGFMHKHIRAEFAKIIDDYFNMFGYATHECKIPNRNVRPHWTYTKTVGCCIVGSVPAEDMRKICNIYNTGITFWRNGNEVGNYSLDNRPV